MPLIDQNKYQVASDTHRSNKIVKKILKWKSNHTYKLIYKKMWLVTCLIKNEVIKTIEHQIHNSRFGELFYQYYTTAVST